MVPEYRPARGVLSAPVPTRTRREPVRLLNKSGTGYTATARALRSGPDLEPEAVPLDYQRMLSARARREQEQARRLSRADLAASPLDVRLARCLAQARALKLDCHGELRLIRLSMEGGRSRAHVERRIARRRNASGRTSSTPPDANSAR
jgi:hypothetical protein